MPKNWVRLCSTIDLYMSRYGELPTQLRMSALMLHNLAESFGPHEFETLGEHIEMRTTASPRVPSVGGKGIVRYNEVPEEMVNSNVRSADKVEEVLGIRPLTSEERGGTGLGIEALCALASSHLDACLRDFEVELPVTESALDEELLNVIDPPLLAESVGGDTHEALRQRVIQALAVGFLNRASGSGLDRLRNAVDLAQRAADGVLDETELIPEEGQEEGV